MLTAIRNWLRSDMLILRWVLLALYGLVLAGVLVLALVTHTDSFWAWLVPVTSLLAIQGFFILGAGTVRLCRPISRKRLWMPVLVAATLMTLLLTGGTAAVLEAVFGNSGPGVGPELFWTGVAISWLVWGVLLWVYVRRDPRMRVLGRLAATLFAGSLLELLAAVPSHVIASRRPYCLAGLLTMFGIVAGLSVMLFSFGPMLVILFLRPRYRREQMEQSGRYCPACEYDLTGTFMAGRRQCPECGQDVAAGLEVWIAGAAAQPAGGVGSCGGENRPNIPNIGPAGASKGV